MPLHAGARGDGGSPGVAEETQDGQRDAGLQEGQVHAGGHPRGTAPQEEEGGEGARRYERVYSIFSKLYWDHYG